MNLETFKKPVDLVVATTCIIVMVALVLCVIWQVFSRWILNVPSTLTDEIARFSMIWVGLLGAAYTVGAQQHLSIDLFVSHLTGKKRHLSIIYSNLCILVFSGSAITWGGIHLATRVYQSGQLSPAIQIPMAYVYLVLPISGVIMSYYSILFIVSSLFRFNRPDPSVTKEL